MWKFCKVLLIHFCMVDFILQPKKWDRKVFSGILGDFKIVCKVETIHLNDKLSKKSKMTVVSLTW